MRRGWRKPDPVSAYVSTNRDHRRDWEHRDVAARALRKPLPPGTHVHHVDENGRNNANRNLVICQDAAYHRLLHRRQRIKRLGGNPNTDAWCGFCRAIRPLSAFWIRKSGESAGLPTPYCRRCRATRSWCRRLAHALGGYPIEATVGPGTFTALEADDMVATVEAF
jgi:hypothetical protein